MDESEKDIIENMKNIFIKEVIPYMEKTLTIQDLFETKMEFDEKYWGGNLKDCAKQLKKSLTIMTLHRAYRTIPELENIVTDKDLHDFISKYEDENFGILPSMTESYIKISDFESAYKALDYQEKELIPLIDSLNYDYRHYPVKKTRRFSFINID